MKEINETIIWSAIINSICYHSKMKPEPTSISSHTKIMDLFPTVNGVDEHANRLGIAMFNLFTYFNEKFNLRLKMDYSPREEFSLFKDVESVYLYWYVRIKSVDQPANRMEN